MISKAARDVMDHRKREDGGDSVLSVALERANPTGLHENNRLKFLDSKTAEDHFRVDRPW